MNYFGYSITVFVTLVINSCNSIKADLDKEDLKFIEPFEIGQKLIYKSEKAYDTFFVVNKTINYSKYKPNGIPPKYLSQIANVIVLNENREEVIISIEKETPENTKYIFTIKESKFYFGMYHNDDSISMNIRLLNGDIKKVLKISSIIGVGKIKTIYWNKNMGLLRYETNGNIIWDLIN